MATIWQTVAILLGKTDTWRPARMLLKAAAMDLRLVPILSIVPSFLTIGCFSPVGNPVPRDVEGLEPAAQITGGGLHTCAILENGNSSCWGSNSSGQLGFDNAGEETTYSIPQFLPAGGDLIAVSSGGLHSCGVLESGSPICWGNNEDNQLNLSRACETTASCSSLPEIVTGIGEVIDIAAGGPRTVDTTEGPSAITCAILADQSVSCWGLNSRMLVSRTVPLSSSPQTILDDGGFPIRQIVKVSAGDHHACALDENGDVFCWGDNENGQTQVGRVAKRIEELPKMIDVVAGGLHTCGVTSARTVLCWGGNQNQQSGDPLETTLCPDPDDRPYCGIPPFEVEGVSNVVSVAAGQRHSCAVDTAGRVICWGSNETGQVGGSQLSLIHPPVQVAVRAPAVSITAGGAHSCALLTSGVVQCWGSNGSGQLGVPGE